MTPEAWVIAIALLLAAVGIGSFLWLRSWVNRLLCPRSAEAQSCPFCGAEPEVRTTHKTYVACQAAGCEFFGPTRATAPEAIDAWNSILVVCR